MQLGCTWVSSAPKPHKRFCCRDCVSFEHFIHKSVALHKPLSLSVLYYLAESLESHQLFCLYCSCSFWVSITHLAMLHACIFVNHLSGLLQTLLFRPLGQGCMAQQENLINLLKCSVQDLSTASCKATCH